MLVAFIIFTVCPTTEDGVDNMKSPTMKNICHSRNEVLMSVGALLTAMVVYKMLSSRSSRNLKAKFKQN